MIRGILRVFIMTVVVIFLVSGAFAGGYAVSRQVFPPALPSDGGAPADWKPYFPVYWEAWNYVKQDFYNPPADSKTLVNTSIDGMVSSLGDPNTRFVDAKTAAISASDLSGSFEGIGATVEMKEGRLTVVAPIKGSPAEKAGILPGDVILQVEDTIIQNMDVTQAITLIRGPHGTPVKLLVQRAKQAPFNVTITRDVIRVPFVESRMIEGTKIAYLRLNDFGATAPDEMRAALQELMGQKPSGLIFDLRRNPGGYLNVSIDVASQFLKQGQTVLIEKFKDGRKQEFKASRGGLATDIPMVLLVDVGSASASEIVAAAIQDYKRATIVGTRTFGKGSVQNVHSLSDKSELRVTVANFFSPLDHQIHHVGIAPDIEIKISDEDLAAKRDPQLDKAIELLSGK
ncbi:carboxyl-terminal processing protease [Anaerolineae bacterium]|nr:carboxyl-terminal processing protease [Anaerolineae bacterium]